MREALISMERAYVGQIHPKMQQIDPAKLVESINPNLPLVQTLAYQTVSGILIGNQNYDRVTMGVSRLFGVREAVSHLSFLGNISVGRELPVIIIKCIK